MNAQNLYAMFDAAGPAARKQARATLAILLIEETKARGWNQTEAAAELSTPQPRMSNLARGKLESISTDWLIDRLARLGITFDLRAAMVRSDA